MKLRGVGDFGRDGVPQISFHLCGVGHEPPGREYTGILDTGFSGYVQVSYFAAMSLRLSLDATGTSILANGMSIPGHMPRVQATFGGDTRTGVAFVPCLLYGGSIPTLVGMDFLRLFELALVLSSNRIQLVDEASLARPDRGR